MLFMFYHHVVFPCFIGMAEADASPGNQSVPSKSKATSRGTAEDMVGLVGRLSACSRDQDAGVAPRPRADQLALEGCAQPKNISCRS